MVNIFMYALELGPDQRISPRRISYIRYYMRPAEGWSQCAVLYNHAAWACGGPLIFQGRGYGCICYTRYMLDRQSTVASCETAVSKDEAYVDNTHTHIYKSMLAKGLGRSVTQGFFRATGSYCHALDAAWLYRTENRPIVNSQGNNMVGSSRIVLDSCRQVANPLVSFKPNELPYW